ncbi:hypothetical protein GYMLUDRAFT_913944 [Collybiopsis luxurians FD-317 M1]|nr:hypothetical protein GYMLUDRAFT_913944 [Collybiopsis luxurians FD-317 M1]
MGIEYSYLNLVILDASEIAETLKSESSKYNRANSKFSSSNLRNIPQTLLQSHSELRLMNFDFFQRFRTLRGCIFDT